jgi:hypothetical protein
MMTRRPRKSRMRRVTRLAEMRLELSTTDFSRAGILAGTLPVRPHLIERPVPINLPARLTSGRTNATRKSEAFPQKSVF